MTSEPNDRNLGLIGAGNFARGVLVPAIKESGFGTIQAVASAGGTSAVKLAEQVGARAVTTEELLADESIGTVVIATSHETHAELTIRALEAGKNVFCEKPLAITESELEAVEAAWRSSGKALAVGFNRRHSPHVRLLRQELMRGAGPLVITYRVNAGRLPASHWYLSRRSGGRILGEVCHFVDTCQAIIDEPITDVAALVTTAGEASLAQDVVLALRFGGGSLATVAYATEGPTSLSKELIEVIGRSKQGVIHDFSKLTVDNRVVLDESDKGHAQQLTAYLHSIRSGDTSDTELAIRSMRATLAAVTSAAGTQIVGVQ